MTVIPQKFISSLLLARAFVLCCLLVSVLSACCNLQSGSYRFQTQFERDPMAFRGDNEAMSVAIKLQNLSDKAICLAGSANDAKGLRVVAMVQTDVSYFNNATVVVGLRGDSCLKAEQNARHAPCFDRRAQAVNELASVGPALLHLSADNIHSSLDLLGNEGDLMVIVPIDWSLVPNSPQVITVDFIISLSLSYVGPPGERYSFPGKLERRVTGYLVNGRRYASGTMPAPNGPIEGEFVPLRNK